MNQFTDASIQNLNDCGCCDGITVQTPAEIDNQPGLETVNSRVGTQAQFLQSMLARLSDPRFPALHALNTREPDDFTIALLDAWATVADVLAFYRERFTQESYLRTATETISLRYLAQLIGYKPRPGVAASTYLAFTLETGTKPVTVEAGTKVQSVPNPGEQAQTFETIEPIAAQASWNAIKPRLTRPQVISTTMTKILLQGTTTNLKPGDSLLLIVGNQRAVRRIASITLDQTAQRTQVTLESSQSFSFGQRESLSSRTSASRTPSPSRTFTASRTPPPRQTSLSSKISTSAFTTVSQADLATLSTINRDSLRQDIASLARQDISLTFKSASPSVFAFRVRAAAFGHNAPRWQSLSVNLRFTEWVIERNSEGAIVAATPAAPAYPSTSNWDNPPRNLDDEDTSNPGKVDLDTVYPAIGRQSWVVLQSPTWQEIYQVNAIQEVSRSDFAISAKVTRLRLDSSRNFALFPIRQTTVLAQSEALSLAEQPIATPVQGSVIELDRRYDGLQIGQAIAVFGITTTAAAENEILSEIAIISDLTVDLAQTRTTITLNQNLQYSYRRETVIINANVARATHGETVTEVLGSGNASQPYQHLRLRQSPLTYISAATPSGTASTLTVRVNGIQWREVPTLYSQKPNDRVFTTAIDDNGKTIVQFGDGRTGRRVPTGQENISATYRKGIGLGGLVTANQLSLLLTRPLGVQGVTNPLPATGADDPESLSQIRRNAPLTVRTLDRIVSLQDYEDFAAAYAGIAKAQATWTWNGQTRGVFVTVAAPLGATIPTDSALYTNLLTAMQQAGDPYVPVRVQSYRPARFRLVGRVKVDPDYQSETVLAAVRQALLAAFSFERRQFGQGVALSEVMAVMQSVAGVIAVDIDQLYRFGSTPRLNTRLLAQAPQAGRDDTNSTLQAAELLTLDTNFLNQVGVLP